MLAIQWLHFNWNKLYRGAPGSSERNHHPKGLSLPNGYFNGALNEQKQQRKPAKEVLWLHYVCLSQTERGILEQMNRIVPLPAEEPLRVGAMEILDREGRCELRYRYEFHRENPPRYRYDASGTYTTVNETAMTLQVGEYGRILYNGRLADLDTGDWFYHMDVINVFRASDDWGVCGGSRTETDLFCAREPDKIYTQMEHLI